MVRLNRLYAIGLLWPACLCAQQTPEIGSILERLDKLERENRALAQQVGELKAKLAGISTPDGATAAADAAAKPSIEERLAIQESRTDEQAQSKVEAAQKFPIRITGMALANVYLNSRGGGGQQYPTAASALPGTTTAGGTLRQSIIGLDFHGPQTFLGGTIHGALAMDFFTGGVSFNSTFRLRTGSIELNWKTRSLMVGIDKPIFNPREPASLAQVGVSPLTGPGNLWLWLPQFRVEQDWAATHSTGVRARLGVVQTHEVAPYDTPANTVAVTASRPALEGRFELYHKFDDDRRIEIAPGFHTSQTHAGGLSIPSRVFSTDWFANPWKPVELTGVFFTGKNVAHLGTGAINEGYVVYGRFSEPITSRGGWDQMTVHLSRRVETHLFAGLQYYQNKRLTTGDITRDFEYGANLLVRIAPNVLLGPEISQLRTLYLGQHAHLNNHYDLALAYMF